MSGPPAVSARLLARRFALFTVLLLVIVGLACGRERFDLLAPSGGGSSGAGQAGMAGLAGAGGGIPKGGAGGAGGTGGFAGGPPCLPGDVCADGGLSCPPTVVFCKRCQDQMDCSRYFDTPFCNFQNGFCVECRPRDNDCNPGQTCDPYFFRCEKACQFDTDCDGTVHPICASRHVCVDCTSSSDCKALHPRGNDACFAGFCVECADNAGCPVDRPICQALHCVAQP